MSRSVRPQWPTSISNSYDVGKLQSPPMELFLALRLSLRRWLANNEMPFLACETPFSVAFFQKLDDCLHRKNFTRLPTGNVME